MKRVCLALMLSFLQALVLMLCSAHMPMPLLAADVGQERIIWEAVDPEGDDHGPGTYIYPTNPAFAPFSGIFDLTGFKVSCDDENVYFDTELANISNIWNAPEGFSHQLINVFIDTTPGAGRTDTLKEGALVSFMPQYAWDVKIKIMGWGGSRVYFASDGDVSGGRSEGLSVEALPNGKTIRAAVSQTVIGEPLDSWKYYVLVGSQDGYGLDNFRPVMGEAGQWVFGGGSDLNINPNVIDILAPENGPYSQESQLGSWNASERRYAMLVPANAELHRDRFSVSIMIVVVAALGIVAAMAYVWLKGRRTTGKG
ncbi:MAG: glucodextranase DOMON-like domain-containing protein [Firmicutes bacterium]|nr:glucodextranase DOMON-like domain-containing protein [Bacillota bacterium]MDD4336540.1 glucodextranase DOMON-like domain-containing protein [Bacillota bacterium]MDD4791720.1 glucodextranase DOMON-like domain-containing protein [Bacillota bacterium]